MTDRQNDIPPCEHPARGGKHEWYIDNILKRTYQCRACGLTVNRKQLIAADEAPHRTADLILRRGEEIARESATQNDISGKPDLPNDGQTDINVLTKEKIKAAVDAMPVHPGFILEGPVFDDRYTEVAIKAVRGEGRGRRGSDELIDRMISEHLKSLQPIAAPALQVYAEKPEGWTLEAEKKVDEAVAESFAQGAVAVVVQVVALMPPVETWTCDECGARIPMTESEHRCWRIGQVVKRDEVKK